MGADLTVRRYEPADRERIWAVHERALRASPLEFVENAPADEDLAAISEEYLASGGEFLVGCVDGDVVAIGGFQLRGDETAELRRLRVHSDYQRRGFGRRLLEALEERARSRGLERLVLETNERLAAARRLYEAEGYEETRREPHPVTGDDVVRYEKEL